MWNHFKCDKPVEDTLVWSVYAIMASVLHIGVDIFRYVICDLYGIQKEIKQGVFFQSMGKVKKRPRPFFDSENS